MSQPRTRLMLDLATAHLPERLGASGLDSEDGVIAHATSYGWLMWVPDDPDDSAISEPPPAEVLRIQHYARRLGCDYVLFDADANRVDDLPTWEW